MNTNNFSGKVSFIWSVADLLRGPYRPNQYKVVMLPMTMLRRIDCVLEPTRDKVLAKQKTLSSLGIVKDLDEFSKRLKSAFKKAGAKVPAALFKAVLMALAERDETAKICTDAKGNPEPDPELRDYENVPLKEDVDEYMKREVLPHVPNAWIDESKTKVGYEINFNRYFYKYTPPRPLEEIETDLKKIEKEIADMLAEVTE